MNIQTSKAGRVVAEWSWAALRHWWWMVTAVAIPVFYVFGIPAVEAGAAYILERPRVQSTIVRVVNNHLGEKLEPLEEKVQGQIERTGEIVNRQGVNIEKLDKIEELQAETRSRIDAINAEQTRRFDQILFEIRRMRQ